MLISQILWMFRQYFIFAVIGVAFLAILFSVIYFLIYKKLFKGQKKINIKRAFIIAVFVCYILMVLYATLFSRESMEYCSVNLDLFSSYVEAWNKYTLRGWQLLILNIVMFVPFGMLLPLVNKKFKSFIWTASAGALFTLLIETIQLICNLGVFEADDLINNFAGALIGYGLVMTMLSILHREKGLPKKITCYLLPLFIVIAGFSSIFIKYNLNELGNLKEAYSQKINCEKAEISSELKLSKESKQDAVYKTKIYDNKTALEYAKQIYKGLGISTEDLDIRELNDFAVYESHKDRGYVLDIDYMGGKYYYADQSSDEYKPLRKPFDEKVVIAALKKMNIDVPEGLKFIQKEDNADDADDEDCKDGEFYFEADMIRHGDKYYLGELEGAIYEDGVIRCLSNNIITLEKYKNVNIISEFEAFENIKQGEFNTYLDEELTSLTVQQVKLEHKADSKGFYQPVYTFKVKINGQENIIAVPAIIYEEL